MFNFGRKKEEKDKKRREKKERHKKFLDGGSVMTQDELNRLSELSRKQSGSPDKLPSGNDYKWILILCKTILIWQEQITCKIYVSDEQILIL